MTKRYKTSAEMESTVIRVFRTDHMKIEDLALTHGWSIGEVVSLILGSLGSNPILPDKVPSHQLQMAGLKAQLKKQ